MRINRLVSATTALAILLSCGSALAWADRGGRDDDRRGGPSSSWGKQADRGGRDDNRRDAPSSWGKEGYVLDRRHHHDHYYPPRGRVIEKLPPHYHVVPHHSTKYYFQSGVWYRPSGTRFVVVVPPVGLVVPFLPPFYTTIWVGSVPYYYGGGVYYVWSPREYGYVVTEPPRDAEIAEEAPESDELFIYPKKGQSEQQQAADRYECHRWAVGQTGFDPTKAGGNVPAAQHASKRSDYQRAMKACLEARGYSVK